jgi:hypothetical protein
MNDLAIAVAILDLGRNDERMPELNERIEDPNLDDEPMTLTVIATLHGSRRRCCSD